MRGGILLLVGILSVGISLSPTLVGAEAEGEIVIHSTHVINLEVGRSIRIDTKESFKRASVANPEVVDQIVLSPTQIYLTGKSNGQTTLTLWDENQAVSQVMEIIVKQSVQALIDNLSDLFPNEKSIVVTQANDHFVLTGHVSNTEVRDQIEKIAGAYAPQKILNFLKISQKQ